jgi:hypothetical protein
MARIGGISGKSGRITDESELLDQRLFQMELR